jgi:hypothetical protein
MGEMEAASFKWKKEDRFDALATEAASGGDFVSLVKSGRFERSIG